LQYFFSKVINWLKDEFQFKFQIRKIENEAKPLKKKIFNVKYFILAIIWEKLAKRTNDKNK